MELRHLRYFVAVAETENVSRAALKLHVSQPGISRQIRDLEDELGIQLFERGAKSIKLTDTGIAFLLEAKAVLLRADEAVQAVRAIARGERGQIHVGYAPSPTVELLPCTLHAFQNAAPDVRVHLHDLSTEEMLQGLGDGHLQLCLMVRVSAKALQGLKFELLREYPFCVAFAPRHAFAKKRRVNLEELASEPLVAYSQAEYPEYHAMLDNLFGATERKPRVIEEHESASGLIAAMEVGRGVAVVPSCMAMLIGGRLELRPLHPAPPPLPVGAVWDPKRSGVIAQKFLASARSASVSPPRRSFQGD